MNRTEELILLKEIAEILNEENEIEPMLQNVLQRLLKLTVFETAWVFLVDDTGTYKPVALTNVPVSLQQQPECLISCGDCWCLERFRNHRLEKAYNTMECRRTELARENNIAQENDFTHHATVPLQTSKKRFGVLNVAVSYRITFTEDELHLLTTIGYQISSALQRIYYTKLEQQLLVIDERQRFAHTLHDSVKQLLFSAQLHTNSIMITNSDQALQSSLHTLQSILQNIGIELHALIEDNRPDSLQNGLQNAVENYATLQGLDLAFRDNDQILFSSHIEEELYRIVQEALNNVVKHAQTKKVTISIHEDNEHYALEIKDFGIGFQNPINHQCIGLQSMKRRAASFHGKFHITSNSKGTTLAITWPKEKKYD
ncbi:MAG: GAF domain-containing sensor histidine kinase [Bacilli bacterium]